jgi:hypothetical protein
MDNKFVNWVWYEESKIVLIKYQWKCNNDRIGVQHILKHECTYAEKPDLWFMLPDFQLKN